MRRLSDGLDALLQRLGSLDAAAAEALRYEHVNRLWETAVGEVFGAAARLVLDHTNTVYLMSPDQAADLRRFDRPRSAMQRSFSGNVLVVYADDSLVRSEIDARQQFLVMKCQQLGEQVEAVVIIPAKGAMKARHPFCKQEAPGGCACSAVHGGAAGPSEASEPLSTEELEEINHALGEVQNPALREAMRRAIGANLDS